MRNGRGLQKSHREVRCFSDASEQIWIWFRTRSVLLGFEKERFKVDRIPRIDRMFEKKRTH